MNRNFFEKPIQSDRNAYDYGNTHLDDAREIVINVPLVVVWSIAAMFLAVLIMAVLP
tara:strand:- start:2 stop:172 length:171 start_codon:yes stop_codon:yes gene_type:complete